VIFHSLDFILFFVAVVIVYWRLPHRAQNLFIIGASYLFYGYVHAWFLIPIAATTVLDYAVGRAIETQPSRKRLWLALSLAGNLGLLGFFKYAGFFAENLRAALALAGISVSPFTRLVVLPVGVSFYTFQELSYTIGVYRGDVRARRNFIDFAAFVCFFPQLVAGPIERASHLLPQVERPRVFSVAVAREATFLMVWGYFKKLVVADNVGILANKVFALNDPAFEVLWAGVFSFGIQIYADFSAYSDIARGTARWLGFDLMRNFDHPYAARGPADFWRRWHISLSSWFRDYVYLPLGGSRRGAGRNAANLVGTFLLSGLWHGASWNYVLWGGYHGILVLAGRLVGDRVPTGRLATLVRIAGTYLLVHLGWLMFRETDITFLLRDLALTPAGSSALDRRVAMYLLLLTAVYALPLVVHAAWDEWRRNRPEPDPVSATLGTVALRAALCGLLLATIITFRSQTSLDFIYFAF
jgi:alginate O-acetyltransferase complex protein AlgI